VAVQVVLEYLRAVGIPCAAQPSDQDVKTEYERIRISMGDRDTSAILDEPLLRDPEILGTHDVLTRAIPPAAFIDINLGSLLICKAVNLSLQSGNCDGSCFSYVMLAQMAGPRFGDGSLGFRFGQLGYDLVEKRGLRRYQACTYVAYAIYTARWVVNERFALTVIRRAFEVAHSNAELNFATLCGPVTTASLLFSGDPLADAEQSAHHGLSIAEKAHFPFAADMIVPQLALIRMLRGSPGSFGQLAPFVDERDFTSRLCGNPAYILAEGKYWVRELQAHFFAGQYHEATGLVGKARLATVTAPGAQEHSEFHFYAALAHAACCEPDSNAQNSEHLTALYDHQRQLEVWATYSPVDYENRALLVGAEIARIEGRFLDAEHLFERAIRTSREGGFTHNQAIANERAADFYSKRGLETIARAYLQAAHSCYSRWGAQGKVAHLRESHPWLREEERPAGPVDTIDAPAAHLDLAAVTKVLQTVSGEIVLDKLLETFMRTVMENSGADRGLFILSAKTGPRIAAEATTENTIVVKLYDAPADGFTVPESILHSVMRTQSSVILDDAAVQHSFSADPYLGQRRPRSVLCMALSNRGKLIGVLYLENGLAPRVFASGRVAVLTLLASQAAMSLENTRLYRDLAERETKIRHLVDANIVGIETVDLDGLILEANDAFLKIIGYDRDDLDAGRLRWTDLTVTHYQGRDREELLAELQGSGKLHTFEWEYVRKDGTRVPVLSGAATYEGGQRAVGFVLDLTDRKRAELALKQGEAYLAEAQRLTHTGSFAYNYLLGQYTYYSDEQYRIYGHDPQSGQLPSLEDIISRIHPEDRDRLLELIERVVREKCEYTVDFRIALPDGTVRYIHSIGHPVVNDAGVLLEHYGTVVDVTERRRAEQRLLAQHHVTRILAEAATVDEATPAILQAISDFLGCSVARVWGVDRKLNALSHKALWRRPTADSIGSETTAVTNTLERGQGLAGRVWANRAAECISCMDAGALTADAQFSADEGLRTALAFPVLLDSEVLGVVEILSHDVWLPDNDLLVTMTTIGSQIGQFMERKRAENALQSAQSELAYTTRVMTMGELAASIAHEVNQPLGAMVTSAGSGARWLGAQPPDIPKAMRALERIINDGRRAGDVIKRIRGLMKRQAPRKTSLQVNDAIREVIALAQHELRRNEIHLDLQLTEGLPPVQGDKVQLQQVFLNLIVNAIEAMKESKERPRLLSIVSCIDVPDLLLVEVRDSGVGLSSEHAAHLFEPFYTTKAEGIGIGLSISRSIVEAHGGQLSAGSNSPRGAVFRLSLPVVEPAAH
jgi:PAS domain S-box-containing protein